MAGRLKSAAVIFLLTVLAPVNLLIVVICLVLENILGIFRLTERTSPNGSSILIWSSPATKGLHMARLFHAKGFRVVWASDDLNWLCAARFSNAVSKFYTVSRRESDYMKALQTIVEKEEDINYFLPISTARRALTDSHLGEVLRKLGIKSLTIDYDTTKLVDDKYRFIMKSKELGLVTPETYLVTSSSEVHKLNQNQDKLKGRKFILKSIQYDSVHRLDLFTVPCSESKLSEYLQKIHISEDQPWIAQEFIEGQEHVFFGYFHNGELCAHAITEVPPLYTFIYKNTDVPDFLEWAVTIGRGLKVSGGLGFDFFKSKNGLAYPIECNPSIGTAVTMFGASDGLVEAMLGEGKAVPSRTVYWLYYELWSLVRASSLSEIRHHLMTIYGGSEAVFSFRDPLPFFGHYHVHFIWLLLQNLIKGKDWFSLQFNFGKVIQEDGD